MGGLIHDFTGIEAPRHVNSRLYWLCKLVLCIILERSQKWSRIYNHESQNDLRQSTTVVCENSHATAYSGAVQTRVGAHARPHLYSKKPVKTALVHLLAPTPKLGRKDRGGDNWHDSP